MPPDRIDMNSIERSLGRIEGRLESIQQQLTVGERRMDGYSARIRKLEGWRWFVIGTAAAVAIIVNWIMSVWGIV